MEKNYVILPYGYVVYVVFKDPEWPETYRVRVFKSHEAAQNFVETTWGVESET